jgi:hypothetical protein
MHQENEYIIYFFKKLHNFFILVLGYEFSKFYFNQLKNNDTKLKK